jgi:hypothetical protein
MSTIRIVKGFPITLLVRVKNDDTTVDVNDGTWNISAELRYQTKSGPKPFDIVLTPLDTALSLELASNQTTLLNHLGSGYVIVVKANKTDNTVFIENIIAVSVSDGL